MSKAFDDATENEDTTTQTVTLTDEQVTMIVYLLKGEIEEQRNAGEDPDRSEGAEFCRSLIDILIPNK